MRFAHLRALYTAYRTEALEPLRGIDVRSRTRHELGLMLALAKLLQQHTVARFETQRIEQIALIGERLGETLCAGGFIALPVARARQLRMLGQRSGELRKRLLG